MLEWGMPTICLFLNGKEGKTEEGEKDLEDSKWGN